MEPEPTQEEKWQKILEFIKEQISFTNYKGWFGPTQLGEFTEGKLTIRVGSAFYKNQLIVRYEQLIKHAVEEVLGEVMDIEYAIDPTLLPTKKAQRKELADEEEEIFSLPQSPQVSSPLNPRYTLQNFIVGSTNNLAYAAAQAIIQSPGTLYNPLFVYGPSGVGKTHLMQGVGSSLVTKNPYAKLIYASSERFLVDFVDSIQNKKMGDFRSKYRSTDILLIDDIQFIAGKDSAQEEFFHTFNELYSRNAQIILTSDRPPNEMQKLESRLMSRFQGGLMVDIQLPDFETRVAILKAKLSERGEYLSDEILALIAENVQSNIRELEGKLIQILQVSKLQNQPITVESVNQFLGKSQFSTATSFDYRKVLTTINHYFNVKQSDLMGPRRQKELVLPRQIAMYLMYQECNLPQEKIGQILGGRDHTTVLHGIEKIKAALNRDREIQRFIGEIKQQLSA